MTDIQDIPSSEGKATPQATKGILREDGVTFPKDYEKSHSEFQQKIRALELLFADVYRRASQLEKELKN
jgi:hypothetical protein